MCNRSVFQRKGVIKNARLGKKWISNSCFKIYVDKLITALPSISFSSQENCKKQLKCIINLHGLNIYVLIF